MFADPLYHGQLLPREDSSAYPFWHPSGHLGKQAGHRATSVCRRNGVCQTFAPGFPGRGKGG
eukprot:5916722-Pyramimonas_sp.AAC.1